MLGPRGFSALCLQLPSQSRQKGLLLLHGEQELNIKQNNLGETLPWKHTPQCSDFMRPVGKVPKGCVISAKVFLPKAVFLNALSFHGRDRVLLSHCTFL